MRGWITFPVRAWEAYSLPIVRMAWHVLVLLLVPLLVAGYIYLTARRKAGLRYPIWRCQGAAGPTEVFGVISRLR